MKLLQCKTTILSLLFLIITAASSLQAQTIQRQCISAYGSSSKVGNATISQTAGQSFNTLSSSENKTAVLQGFQQPNKFIIEDITDPKENNLLIGIFPNPAIYSVTLTSEVEIANAEIRIFDANGRIISNEKISNFSSCEINCQDWSAGTYLITVSDGGLNTKTLRLIITK